MKKKTPHKGKKHSGKPYRIDEYKAVNIKSDIKNIYDSLITLTSADTQSARSEDLIEALAPLKAYDTAKLHQELKELEYKIIDLQEFNIARKLLDKYPLDKVKEAKSQFKRRYGSADHLACEKNRIERDRLVMEIDNLKAEKWQAIRQRILQEDILDKNLAHLEDFRRKFNEQFGRKSSLRYILRFLFGYNKQLAHIAFTEEVVTETHSKVLALEEEENRLQLEIIQRQNDLRALSCNEAGIPIELVYGFLVKISTWLDFRDSRDDSSANRQDEEQDPRVAKLRKVIVPSKLDAKALVELANMAKPDDHSLNAALLTALLDEGCILDKYGKKFEPIKRDFYAAVGFDTAHLGSFRYDSSGTEKKNDAREFVAILLDDTSKRKVSTKP